MKKHFLFACTAIVALLMTACSEEDNFRGQDGNVVTFSVGVPQLATRAIGEGNSANKLYWGVYDHNSVLLTEISDTLVGQDFSQSGTVHLTLAQDKNYSIIFWAANKDNSMCTVNWKSRTMTVNPTEANQEAYDAFCAYVTIDNVSGYAKRDVTLYRPFAQLNIGTADVEKAGKSGLTVQNTKVEIEGLPTVYNFVDGTTDGSETFTYNYPDPATSFVGEAFPVNGYDYLAMNYALVAADKELVTVKFTYMDDDDEEHLRTYTSVPVQRNWRTNIYGNILTSEADFTVTIEPEFAKGDHEPAELFLAAANGGEVTLTEDVVLTAPLNVQANMTIDLNGKTISGNWHKDEGAVIKVENKVSLKLIGGTLQSLAENGGSALQNKGTAILEGTTLNGAPNANGSWPSYTVNNTGTLTLNNSTITSYHGAVASYGDNAVVTLNDCVIDMTGIAGFTSHGIYTYNNGKVVVNGGTYENKATDQAASGASVINGNIEVNAGTFNGRIENYYGTPVLKGGTYSVKPNNNFVAAGFKVLEKAGKWYVVPEEVTAVADSEAEIRSALKQKDAIVYVYPTEDGSSYKLEGKLSLAEGVKLIGAGDEPVALFNDWGSNAFANQAHFTNTHIENVYFSNNLVIDAGIANGNVTFKGCVFGGDLAHQGVHFDSGNGTITFDDCTFVGRNMFGSSLEKVIFNNCKFENKKSSQTGADKWTGVNMWGKYEFNNCEFDTEATCNVKCDGVIADFNNCFYSNGKNIKEVIRNSPAYTCTIKFDGIVVGGYATTEILNKEGVTYQGDFFENPINNALYFENWILEGNATIKVVNKTYGAIILEGVKGNLNGDAIVIENANNSVMILANCDFTLAEGKKLIKSANTIYQVFMTNITINGEKLTQESAAQYLENVGWYQVVEDSSLL